MRGGAERRAKCRHSVLRYVPTLYSVPLAGRLCDCALRLTNFVNKLLKLDSFEVEHCCFKKNCGESVNGMDLSCGENMENSGNQSRNGRQVDMCVAGPDRALDRDPRVLMNLMALERAHALHTDYFQNVQTDIQPFMRKVVTTWMLEVSNC